MSSTKESIQEDKRIKKTGNPRGTRDFGPEDVVLRENMIGKIKSLFELYGGLPIDTPVMECMRTVTGLYGEEFDKLVYELDDQGGEKLILRYDLTVPFARYIANNGLQQFKRYQIGKVYRRDQPQIFRGRYREFYQCDFDIVGGVQYGDMSMLQEIEIIKLLYDILNELINKDTYQIKINHRLIIQNIFTKLGIPSEKINTVTSAVDRMDKVSREVFFKELIEKGISEETATNLLKVLDGLQKLNKQDCYNVLDYLNKEGFVEGELLNSMELFFKTLDEFGILKCVEFDPIIARGMDYYTGLIYEATYNDKEIMSSSIAAGGRYDNMLGKLSSKKNIPAIGLSIGLERIITILENTQVSVQLPKPVVFVASVGKNMAIHRLKLVLELRERGINADMVYNSNPKMRAQFDKVFEEDNIKIPYMLVIGENEINKNTVKLKIMESHEEYEKSRKDALDFLCSITN
jgi:histidyl-tRNA synthetase